MADNRLYNEWKNSNIQKYQDAGLDGDDLNRALDQNNPYSGMPDAPDYHSNLNPDGTINPNLALKNGPAIEADHRGIDAFRNEALRNPATQSAWAQMMTGRQQAQETNQMNQVSNQSASATANANGDLAMRGGLTSGARERVATQGANDMLSQQQAVARQGSDQRMNIGIQDETNREGNLRALPGMEIAELEPDFRNRAMDLNTQQFNIQNSLNEKHADDLEHYSQYQDQMKAWAAGKQSDATQQDSGGKK